MTSRARVQSVFALGILVLVLACNFGQQPKTPEVVRSTATAEPTLAPSPTPAPPTAVPGLSVSLGGLTFTVPEGLAAGASGEEVPASTDPDAVPYWDLHPAYTEIRLDGYQLTDTFHYARVAVYPVAEYTALFEGVQQAVVNLKALIADPTLDLPSLPMIPIWNAAQLFHAQVAPVGFQGGNGIRYLAEYGQDVHPISNSGMFYTFQGLTDDGRYYVTAVLPVSHPDLPPDAGNMTGEEYESFASTFEAYLLDLTAKLNAATPESFAPSLKTLDALVETIQVTLP